MMKISVIVVTLNSGKALTDTIDNITRQTYSDYEILIKDGGSSDGSIDIIRNRNYSRVRIVESKDTGIYDAMNQAVGCAEGDYVIFINAGDTFYDENVLAKMAERVSKNEMTIAYGDTFFELSNSLSKAPSIITGSVCYRNIPCHQAIFYSKDIFKERQFDTDFRIRADYEHFLWAFYSGKCSYTYLDFPVCRYEGGGFSESKANKRRDKDEYIRAVRRHIPLKQRIRYRLFLILTLYKLRGALARNTFFAPYYQMVKEIFQK